MVNSPGVSSQSASREDIKPGECPPDNKLPENSKENLDARLDHAIEETFPTSDPISVTVTKKAVAEVPRETASSISSNESREDQDQAEQETAENLLEQVKEALQDVAQTASGTVREAYTEGQHYAQHARERHPQAKRYIQEGRQALHQRITENPWPYLIAAAAVGYLLGWMIHGEHRGRDRRVPDYARTRPSYASHRDDQHEV